MFSVWSVSRCHKKEKSREKSVSGQSLSLKSWLVNQLRVAVAEEWGQFRNTQEVEISDT
jgi:hypothetical protein